LQSAADAIENAGGRALTIAGDVRDEASVCEAVERTVEEFGGLDICVNNASAIDLSPTVKLTTKRYDLMQAVNARGTFLLSRACIPHLARSDNAHILTLSPPLNLNPRWLAEHLGYTIAKYGMSLCTLGLAEELKGAEIAVNSLWPKTMIATAAVQNLLGGEEAVARARRPEIMADAAYAILTRPAADCTGHFLIDEDVLREEGVTEFDQYRIGPEEPALDLFLEPERIATA
jgi:citronellol/citronellal dehydrogenase